MKDEYDFSNAEQGKFYVPAEEIQISIYLDKDVALYLSEKCRAKILLDTCFLQLQSL